MPLNWDKMINENDDDGNWAYAGVGSGRRSYPGDSNNNDEGSIEKHMKGGVWGTRNGKGMKDGKAKRKSTEDEKQNVRQWRMEKRSGSQRRNGRGKNGQISKGTEVLN